MVYESANVMFKMAINFSEVVPLRFTDNSGSHTWIMHLS